MRNLPKNFHLLKRNENTLPNRLDRYIAQNSILSYGYIQKLIRTRKIRMMEISKDKNELGTAVKVNNSTPILPIHQIYVHESIYYDFFESEEKPKKSSFHLVAKKFIDDHVIYEDAEIIIINKPAGISCQGGVNIQHSVDVFAKLAYNLKLTHRLDRQTSGALILAKNKESAQKITKMFQEQKISKIYHAIVVNTPILDNLYLESGLYRIDKDVIDNERVLNAVTYFRILAQKDGYSFLELHPKTGRKHQIRQHCLSIGSPILYDSKYCLPSSKDSKKDTKKDSKCIMLHAYSISCNDFNVEVPYPSHWEKFLL